MITFEPLEIKETVPEPRKSKLIRKDLFSMPIFEKTFLDHKEFKENVISYLRDDQNYVNNTIRPTLKFTPPILYKEPLFKPFVDFVNESLRETFEELGFAPKFEITGLWATKQNMNDSYHHRHIHHNTFLGGVYYLNGENNKTAGTMFYSDWKQPIIEPAVADLRKQLEYKWESSFEEGKLVIFPSWIEHGTNINSSNSERIILSFNCMPVGKTNTDPFERYNYQSVADAEMIIYNREKYLL